MKNLKFLLVSVFFIFGICCISYAAWIDDSDEIPVRAGGSGSTQTALYQAYYDLGDSGECSWSKQVPPEMEGYFTITLQPDLLDNTKATLSVTAYDTTPVGSYNVSITATPSSSGQAATKDVTILVIQQLGSIVSPTIPDGKEETSLPSNIQFTVSSGSGNYSWALSGAPTGIIINTINNS
ncbi:MAG TPA: hypothetical protein PKX05_03025, partial [bacterium]|nr:hypothetical protein [bacterium]